MGIKGFVHSGMRRIPWLRRRLDRKFYHRLDFPRHIGIEPTNKCNLRCRVCHSVKIEPDGSRIFPDKGRGEMSMATFERILAGIPRDRYVEMTFALGGEPLIVADKVVEFLHRAREHSKQLYLVINSNCRLLTPEVGEKLLDSPLNFAYLALQTATPVQYEWLTGSDAYAETEENIRRFLQRKRELGRKDFKAEVQILKLKETAGEIAAFKQRWGELADSVFVRDVRVGPHADADLRQYNTYYRAPSERFPCFYPWFSVDIGANGDMFICGPRVHIGTAAANVHDISIADYWRQNPALMEFRSKQQVLELDELCQNCDVWGEFPNYWKKRDGRFDV